MVVNNYYNADDGVLAISQLRDNTDEFTDTVVLFDPCDCELIQSVGKWFVTKQGYISSCEFGTRSFTFLHRRVINAPTGVEVDHISRDKLDNRKANLRLCSRSENLSNRRSWSRQRILEASYRVEQRS